jgi:hypothetical protein
MAVKLRRMKAKEPAARREETKKVHISVGKPHWRRLLGTCKSRWKDDIKVNLKEMDGEGVKRTHLFFRS